MLKVLFSGILFSLATCFYAAGQVQSLPEAPTVDDTVTILFFPDQGNGALAGEQEIYAHTGVLTQESNHWSEWRYVKADWGQNLDELRLQPAGDGSFRMRFHIRSFYGIPASETVTHLVFVFRNPSGSKVGRAADGADILLPLGQTPALQSYSFDGVTLVVESNRGNYRIEGFAGGVIGVRPGWEGTEEASLAESVVGAPLAGGVVWETDSTLEFSVASSRLVIRKDPWRFRFYAGEELMLEEELGYFADDTYRGIRFSREAGEVVQGTGFRTVPIDRSGRLLGFYNRSVYGYHIDEELQNINIPLFVSSRGYGLFFEHDRPSFAGIGDADPEVFDYRVDGEPFTYYFLPGPGPEAILDRYTRLTGRQPLPPLWALGYIQSRFGYRTQEEARMVVADLQDAGFPLDALILDLYWFGEPADMGDLDWYTPRFPDPVGLMDDLQDVGVKTVLITETYFTTTSKNYGPLVGQGFLGKTPQGGPYVMDNFWVGPAALLDITHPGARAWFWPKYRVRIEEGVAGWWSDLGEPELHPQDMQHFAGDALDVHNPYSLLWARLLWENYRKEYPGQRLFNLIRSGYSGMQRYSTFPWSGDVSRSWEGLRAQIPAMLGMSMSGVSYMHSDLGGFTGQTNPELFARWMQLGAFSPVMRAHGTGGITEPVYLPEPYRSVCRDFIQLRYALLPYNYHLAWQNTTTGLPLAMPMDFWEPQNTSLQHLNDQFFWGADLVVAPVMTEGARTREVSLPAGNWVNYWTDEQHAGNQRLSVDAPLEQLPLFVRGGSFLPTAAPLSSTDQFAGDDYRIHYYLDPAVQQSERFLYEDDGVTPDAYANGAYRLIRLRAEDDGQAWLVTYDAEGPGYTEEPADRTMELIVHGMTAMPATVSRDGAPLTAAADLTAFGQEREVWYFDGKVLRVRTAWNGDRSVIRMEGVVTALDPAPMQEEGLQVSPNPFREEVRIAWRGQTPLRVQVLNALGQPVADLKPEPGNGDVLRYYWHGRTHSGRPAPAGMYVVQLTLPGGKTVSRKIIRLSDL